MESVSILKRKNTAAVPGRLSGWKSEGACSSLTSSQGNSGNKKDAESENSSGQLNGYFLGLKVQFSSLSLCQKIKKKIIANVWDYYKVMLIVVSCLEQGNAQFICNTSNLLYFLFI